MRFDCILCHFNVNELNWADKLNCCFREKQKITQKKSSIDCHHSILKIHEQRTKKKQPSHFQIIRLFTVCAKQFLASVVHTLAILQRPMCNVIVFLLCIWWHGAWILSKPSIIHLVFDCVRDVRVNAISAITLHTDVDVVFIDAAWMYFIIHQIANFIRWHRI